MSSFNVSHETINRIVDLIDARPRSPTAEIFKPLNADELAHEWNNRVGARLCQLNANAVNCRYGSTDATRSYKYKRSVEIRQLNDTRDRYGLLNPDEINALCVVAKSLACYLYQASDINECAKPRKEDEKLFKALEELHNMLMREIATGLPAYNKAVWG